MKKISLVLMCSLVLFSIFCDSSEPITIEESSSSSGDNTAPTVVRWEERDGPELVNGSTAPINKFISIVADEEISEDAIFTLFILKVNSDGSGFVRVDPPAGYKWYDNNNTLSFCVSPGNLWPEGVYIFTGYIEDLAGNRRHVTPFYVTIVNP